MEHDEIQCRDIARLFANDGIRAETFPEDGRSDTHVRIYLAKDPGEFAPALWVWLAAVEEISEGQRLWRWRGEFHDSVVWSDVTVDVIAREWLGEGPEHVHKNLLSLVSVLSRGYPRDE